MFWCEEYIYLKKKIIIIIIKKRIKVTNICNTQSKCKVAKKILKYSDQLHLLKYFTFITLKYSEELRPVHVKDDNYNDNDKDIVLKIVLNIKELKSSHRNYNDNGTEKQYRWNLFQNVFFFFFVS